mmetsp:Transcript_50018/g.132193  ORF Transcript_50018/g.132193 Transcript_50018/m.132193 type:complete len:236 (+) Transcript_50018:995-1702(+)
MRTHHPSTCRSCLCAPRNADSRRRRPPWQGPAVSETASEETAAQWRTTRPRGSRGTTPPAGRQTTPTTSTPASRRPATGPSPTPGRRATPTPRPRRSTSSRCSRSGTSCRRLAGAYSSRAGGRPRGRTRRPRRTASTPTWAPTCRRPSPSTPRTTKASDPWTSPCSLPNGARPTAGRSTAAPGAWSTTAVRRPTKAAPNTGPAGRTRTTAAVRQAKPEESRARRSTRATRRSSRR